MASGEILAEILERPRRAFVPLPDLQMIERPGWRQIVTPSVKRGGFNEVSLAQLDERDADAVIDATIAHYRTLGCRFVWRVGPDSAPADLAARLARRGLVHGVGLGMARSTDFAGDPTGVEEVDATTVDVYTRVLAEGWGTLPIAAANELAVRADRRAPSDAAPAPHLFLARVAGEPAAAASSMLFARSVYLIGGVTLERFRGRGAYRALIAARLAHARARGIALAITIARAGTSAPILERLGFAAICRFDSFSSD